MSKRIYKVEFIENDLKKPVVTCYLKDVNIVEVAIAANIHLNKDLNEKHKDKKLRVSKIEEIDGEMI